MSISGKMGKEALQVVILWVRRKRSITWSCFSSLQSVWEIQKTSSEAPTAVRFLLLLVNSFWKLESYWASCWYYCINNCQDNKINIKKKQGYYGRNRNQGQRSLFTSFFETGHSDPTMIFLLLFFPVVGSFFLSYKYFKRKLCLPSYEIQTDCFTTYMCYTVSLWAMARVHLQQNMGSKSVSSESLVFKLQWTWTLKPSFLPAWFRKWQVSCSSFNKAFSYRKGAEQGFRFRKQQWQAQRFCVGNF